jgi:hypothetical protein
MLCGHALFLWQSPSREERRVNLQLRESPVSPSPQGQPKRRREGVTRHRAVERDQQPDQTALLKQLEQRIHQYEQDALHQQKENDKQRQRLEQRLLSMVQQPAEARNTPPPTRRSRHDTSRENELEEEVAKGRRNRKRLDTALFVQQNQWMIQLLQAQCED